MLSIPVAPVPSQTLQTTLGGQPAQIGLRSNNGHLFFDLIVNDVVIVRNRICRNQQPLLLAYGYRGFEGELIFVDTQGETDPTFSGLGSRYQLVYVGAAE